LHKNFPRELVAAALLTCRSGTISYVPEIPWKMSLSQIPLSFQNNSKYNRKEADLSGKHGSSRKSKLQATPWLPFSVVPHLLMVPSYGGVITPLHMQYKK
jgi:hypothetical protein